MLTKSDVLSYRQCPRKLWLEKHRPDLWPSSPEGGDRRKIEGAQVGKVAQRLLGPVAMALAYENLSLVEAAASAKAALLQDPTKPATEVPFVRAGVYVRADALVPEQGGYILQEIKASTFPLKPDRLTPGKPKRHYVEDVAIQAWVMEESGLECKRVELTLLDNQWAYPGGEDFGGLFRQLDVTDLMPDKKAEVPGWIRGASETLTGAMPEIATGAHCKSPYVCPFVSYCKSLEPSGPEDPLDLLPDMSGKKLAKRLREEKGYISILDPRPEELTGTDAALYRRIQRAHRERRPILEPGSAEIMQAFSYPRYYLDFEGIDFAVPRWQGVHPYEQIPFQWSCHIERHGDPISHEEFLDLSGQDPSRGCVEALLVTLNDPGPIFVYNATYERTRLMQLAARFPNNHAILISLANRLVDLLPIVRDHFYAPAMKGSFSIKSVLPAIAPDLDYQDLDGVSDGTAAQVAYINAAFGQLDEVRSEEIAQSLRRYCRQDTWAMVEIAHFLQEEERPRRPAE